MIKLVIISGICFTIGNAIWPLFDEQKLLYIPQAIFFISMLTVCKRKYEGLIKLFLTYLLLLAYGNLVKQVFYSDILKQINDYIWGGLVTLWLLYNIKNNLKWQTLSNQSGKK
jgi:hypothetical protein